MQQNTSTSHLKRDFPLLIFVYWEQILKLLNFINFLRICIISLTHFIINHISIIHFVQRLVNFLNMVQKYTS